MGFDYRISTGLGKTDSSLSKQNLCTKTRGKGAVTSQETEPDLSPNFGGSPVEMCIGNGSPRGQGHRQQQSWKRSLGVDPLGGRHYVHGIIELDTTE